MSLRTGDLYLFEEVILLALKDDKGTFYAKQYLPSLAGAIMAELLLEGRVRVEGKRDLVDLVDDRPFGEPLLDETLERIGSAKRRATLQTWVSRVSGISKLKRRALEGLCRRNILKEDSQKILLLFKRRVFPERDHGPEQRIVERLREAIFGRREDLEARTIVLLALAQASDLLSIHFARRELKEKKERIKQIVDGDLIGDATKGAIEAVQAAILVTTVIPVIVASTST